MSEPTLSVVMINYNHSQFLPRAIQSILCQSFIPHEFIIIDDRSTDNSVDIIEHTVKEHPSIKFYRNDINRGVHYSVNRGLKIASGEYVYIAAVDDMVYSNFFEESMRLLAKYPQAGICSSIVNVINADGSSIIRMPLINPSSIECYLSPVECMRLLRKYDSLVGYSSRIFRRDAFLECGGLIPELSAFADLFLDMLLALKYGACFIPKEMAFFTLTPHSLTERFRSSIDEELKCYAYVANLMRTTYADLFPLDYANSWEKRITYRARLSAAKRMLASHMDIISDTMPHKNLFDKFVFLCVRLGMYLQFLILIVYLYMRLGPEMRTVLQRGLLIKIKSRRRR